MKFKLLLLCFLMSGGLLFGQTAYTGLIISEARIDDAHHSYVEFTNVGDQTINLSEFEFGKIDAWTVPWEPSEDNKMMLPDTELAPGESFVIATVYDYAPKMWKVLPDFYNERITKIEMLSLADIQMHRPESDGEAIDSVSEKNNLMTVWGGRDCWYLEHHFAPEDSTIVDQVNGIFEEDDGTSTDQANDVAGITDGSYSHLLIRKFSIKNGNTDFDVGRGNNLDESEWIPIPYLEGHWEPFRKAFWTVGNHGDYSLDASTLTSSEAGIEVDFDNKVLRVPWGVRNQDSLMMAFDYTPGLAWHYDLAPSREDSAYISARSGDQLTVYACGTEMDSAVFTVELLPPTDDENRVLPKSPKNANGFYPANPYPQYRVTEGLAMDTIHYVPFATRTDSLEKYLEKAPQASWKFILQGDQNRPDVIDGDILRVTSKNGAPKDYYIKVEEYHPAHDADLAAITWPDIPDNLRNKLGWNQDTIPNFEATKFNYKIELPSGTTQLPAFVATLNDPNAALKVDKARYLFGTAEDRTTTFTVTAEDDTTINVYTVQVEVKKDASTAQPFTTGEPFISELALRQAWNSTFIEICNPNGIPLDMSNYMIMRGGSSAVYEAVDDYTLVEDSLMRYNRYVPGYKWQTTTEWAQNPAILEEDVTTPSVVDPGDVFVIGVPHDDHWKIDEVDFDFRHPPFEIETQFTHDDWGAYGENRNVCSGWITDTWYLFKITNDSLKQGLKPANDYRDFRILDVFGDGDYTGTPWSVGGEAGNQNQSYIRKAPYYKGDTIPSESFGTTPEDCEWKIISEAYFADLGYPYPQNQEMIADNIGAHFFNDITEHLSTVTSRYFKISDGYSENETIEGLIDGITVEDFLADIVKAQADQTISVLDSDTEDLELTGTDVITDGDTLMVVSANGNVTTKYILTVDANGLSGDAVLTSSEYTINVNGDQGTVEGFTYGTTLRTVTENVTVPDGAVMTIVDELGAYMPMKMLRSDTVYVDVMATDEVFFEVVAENGRDTITYQLIPTSASTDAFVLSYVYEVDEENKMIRLLPGGLTVGTLLDNLIPAMGATMKVVDKEGFDRTSGEVYRDDKVVVTAQDGTTQSIYTLEMFSDLEFYQAYVTSTVYVVVQGTLAISGGASINDALLISDFLANLDPVTGATMTVVDANDNPKDPDEKLAAGDKLEVVSANGLATVYYTIDVQPSMIDGVVNRELRVYPNPARGYVYVDGLQTGDKLSLYNVMGAQIMERIISGTREELSLGDYQKGVYILVVSTGGERLGNFKLVVE